MTPEQKPLSGEPYAAERPRPVQPERIPGELRAYPQWVCWRYVPQRGSGKPAKQPVNPHTLHSAGVHWANTWGSFEEAYAVYDAHQTERRIDGIGFVLTRDDPFVGLDLDHCITECGIDTAAQTMIEDMASYTEISPSGTGLRILVVCPEFHLNARTPQLEVYSHSRFLTLTGHHLERTPQTISAVTPAVLHALLPGRREPKVPTPVEHPSPIPEADGMALWAHIFAHDKYGADHARRFQGDLSLDRNDHSFSVIRLLNCLARWTDGDPGRMRSMMLLSPLANEKWLSKRGQGDWLDHQIADAIRHVRGGK